MSPGTSRCRLVTLRGVMIVGNLDTQFPSVGPNPPISLRERGSRAEEKGGIVARDSAVKRGAYSTKLRSQQDNGCPSLAHSHTVSTQLYQTPLSFLPPLLCSVLSLSLSLSRPPFFSLIAEGRGIMKPRAVLGARGEELSRTLSLLSMGTFSSPPFRRPAPAPPTAFVFGG